MSYRVNNFKINYKRENKIKYISDQKNWRSLIENKKTSNTIFVIFILVQLWLQILL